MSMYELYIGLTPMVSESMAPDLGRCELFVGGV